MINDTILDAIGQTPMVAVRTLNPNPRVRLLAKLEYFNPGGSIKDRVALSMIAAGERPWLRATRWVGSISVLLSTSALLLSRW